jgi:hypothetical protein
MPFLLPAGTGAEFPSETPLLPRRDDEAVEDA